MKSQDLKKIGLVLSVVSELTTCIGGGVAIGYFFWSKEMVSVVWAGLISLLGFGLGFYRLIRFAQRFSNQRE